MNMLFSDLDGTLKSSYEERISFGVINKLLEIQKCGVQLCIASGRNYIELKNILCNLDNIYYISDDGGLISHKEETIYKREIPIDSFYNIDCDFIAHGKYMVFVKSRSDYFKIKIASKYSCHTVFVESTDEIKSEIFKITVYGDFVPKGLKKVYENKEFSEYVSHETSKGNAADFLLDYLKLKESDCYFIGDNVNDISMLSGKTNSYVMKHALKTVKEEGTYVVENIISTLEDIYRRCRYGSI